MFIQVTKRINLGNGEFLNPGKAHQVKDAMAKELIAKGYAKQTKAVKDNNYVPSANANAGKSSGDAKTDEGTGKPDENAGGDADGTKNE